MREEESKVDKLNETLYSRTHYHNPGEGRKDVPSRSEPEISEQWSSPKLDEILSRERVVPNLTPFMKRFFIFALCFFLFTVGVAAFVFFGGSTFVSSKNVDLTVVGPSNTPAGEMVELEVTIKNGNNADLELANFSIQYPKGARDPQDSSRELTFNKEPLGVIKAGDEVIRTVRFSLVGQMSEMKELKFSIEYKVKGSSATFYKDKTYELLIGESPLRMTITAPDSVASGETFKTIVEVTLDSTEVLKNVMLRAEYPYGYSALSSSPAAFAQDNVWSLGDLSPGGTKKIEINGKLLGENQDERTFRFYTGVAEGSSPNANFESIVLSAQESVTLERAAVALSINLNGDTGAVYVAPAGQPINGTIRAQNNLSEKLLNPRLNVRFSGSAFDESSVQVYGSGFYNSGTDTASWEFLSLQGLRELNPGDKSEVTLRFASLPLDPSSSNARELDLEISFSGTSVSGQETITAVERRKVKIASQVTLSSKALYSIGPFINKGTLPPKAEKETTYAVVWSVGNTQNDLTEAKVTARLGPAVTWLGAHSEGGENITYDTESNTVTWNIGTLASGVGFATPLREVAFQVSLTPSLSQVGLVPTLVSAPAFTGFETVAQRTINVSNAPITTRLSSDPEFISGDDAVVK